MKFIIVSFVFCIATIQAQFIQRWYWAFEEQHPGSRTYHPVPYWRREPSLPFRKVLFPDSLVTLQYNCAKMPSICKNVENWMADASKSKWVGKWDGWFTYDMGTRKPQRITGSSGVKEVAEWRRSYQCPSNWKGTIQAPRCPEPDQPPLYPVWADFQGNPITEIVSQIGKKSVRLEVAAKTDPNGGKSAPSGRLYSCDEFPPASWIEGGGGIDGQGVDIPEGRGGFGTTYCAPIGQRCGSTRGVGTEQNWQGLIHGVLKNVLEEAIRAQRNTKPHQDEAVAFAFSLEPAGPQNGITWATRVSYRVAGVQVEQTRGLKVKRRSTGELVQLLPRNATAEDQLRFGNTYTADELLDMGWSAVEISVNNMTDGFWSTTDGRKFAAGDLTAVKRHISQLFSEQSSHTAERSGIPRFMSTLATNTGLRREQAQWNPTENVDIISNGEGNVLGQIHRLNSYVNVSSTLRNTDQNAAGAELYNTSRSVTTPVTVQPHLRRSENYSPKNHSLPSSISRTVPSLQKRKDSDVLCSRTNPCLDGSCCNKQGYCGFTPAHCGLESCISNCNAEAMCGIHSANSSSSCELNLCCSHDGWCGTTEAHCRSPTLHRNNAPCQAGFGSCIQKSAPRCTAELKTSKGRRAGFYQGWNSWTRPCDTVRPHQINTRGFTHLIYAFAQFDPSNFKVLPVDAQDVPTMLEFNQLKRKGLETWISVGGWDFSTLPTTRTAFSRMVSLQANRHAFIRSLLVFMKKYGFQGVDISWYYPAARDRGGCSKDTDNLVLLMKEMKELFNGQYGSSVTLAPSYEYLRGFRPAAMQEYVDFMNFIAYDLHGPEKTKNSLSRSKVHPHTDVTDIENNLKLLWFDGVDPAKINLGLASYGRTLKLSKTVCGIGNKYIPGASGTMGACTRSKGMLSNSEIHRIIQELGVTPNLNKTAMTKSFIYDTNSWVGYDDAETYLLKEGFADKHCLGGLSVWSVDLDNQNPLDHSPDPAPIWVSPDVWNTDKPLIQCPFPCTIALPPFPYSTTIDYPRITVSQNGTARTTLTFPPLTISELQMQSIVVPASSSCITINGERSGSLTCSTNTGRQEAITSTLQLRTTSTWPPVTWYDPQAGESSVTQPPGFLPDPTQAPIGPSAIHIPPNSGAASSIKNTEPETMSAKGNTVLTMIESVNQPTLSSAVDASNTAAMFEEKDIASTMSVERSSSTHLILPSVISDTLESIRQNSVSSTALTMSAASSVSKESSETTTSSGVVFMLSSSTRGILDPSAPSIASIPSETVVPTTMSVASAVSLGHTDSDAPTTTTVPPVLIFPPVTGTGLVKPPGTNGPAPTGAPLPSSPPDVPPRPSSPPNVPPCPYCPPPPPIISLPPITIIGSPPSPSGPTTTPCAFNSPECPPPWINPDSDEGAFDEEDPEERECIVSQALASVFPLFGRTSALPSPSPSVSPSSPSPPQAPSTPPSPPAPPPAKTPDFDRDSLHCYDKGQIAIRAKMINAINSFCGTVDSRGRWVAGQRYEFTHDFGSEREASEAVSIKIVTSIELKPGCEWQASRDSCVVEMKKMVDQCDTNGENRKQGGTIEGDCIKWRIDPNSSF